jgi:hypothetical protein
MSNLARDNDPTPGLWPSHPTDARHRRWHRRGERAQGQFLAARQTGDQTLAAYFLEQMRAAADGAVADLRTRGPR